MDSASAPEKFLDRAHDVLLGSDARVRHLPVRIQNHDDRRRGGVIGPNGRTPSVEEVRVPRVVIREVPFHATYALGHPDRDGHDASEHGGDDCDDTDADLSPSAQETWYDGVDQDCDETNEYDADGDGYDSDAHEGDDCDDTDAGTHPEATDTPGDGIDQDCDGVDAEDDGGDDTGGTGGDGDGTGDDGGASPAPGGKDEGCGCVASVAAPVWVAWLAPFLILRRRESGRSEAR